MDETLSAQLADAHRWISACEDVIRGFKKDREEYRKREAELMAFNSRLIEQRNQAERELNMLKASKCLSCRWYTEYHIRGDTMTRCNLRGENTEANHYCRKHENSLK